MQVTFKNINKAYGDFYAVRDLDLVIEDGALHFLLGPSGCGKTTTLRMLAGLETVSSGSILFGGRDVTKLPAAERGIGMVFQNYALWPHMTVRKNIEYGLKLRKLSSQEVARRVDEVLDFSQLTRFVDRLPGQLSGGQQQRVALARALAIRPSVLLLDEPLSNLDAQLRLEMRDNISRIHKQTGITTVYVTHDQKEALSMGSKVSVMHAGRLIQTAPPRSLYHTPKTPFIASFIGETNLVPGSYEGLIDGRHLVATALGTMQAERCEGSYQKGDKVVASFRPESIRLAEPASEGGGNILDVSLEHLTYLGESEQLALKGRDETRLKATIFHAHHQELRDGDGLRCVVAPADVLILPEGQDIGPGT